MTHAEKEERNQKIVALRKQGYSMTQLQEMYGLKSVWHICKKYGVAGVMSDRKPEYDQERYADKRTEQEKKEIVESYLPIWFSYESGYTNCDSHVNLRCKICGCVFDASMVSVRKGHMIKCPACSEQDKEDQTRIKKQNAERQKKAREEERRLKALEKAKLDEARLHPCQVCGNLTKKKYCCCSKCSRKRNNSIKEVRRRVKLKNAIVDKDITLESVYRRDRGVCYICGGLCDWNDRAVKDKCVVCGNSYPSLDHVIPLAKGGLHEWGNVRLAHRICNSLKADDDIPLVKISS